MSKKVDVSEKNPNVLLKVDPTDPWMDNVELIRSFWDEQFGRITVSDSPDDDGYYDVVLVTGGWSENEEVIQNLKCSWFWNMFWYKSVRGGLYVLKVKTII